MCEVESKIYLMQGMNRRVEKEPSLFICSVFSITYNMILLPVSIGFFHCIEYDFHWVSTPCFSNFVNLIIRVINQYHISHIRVINQYHISHICSARVIVNRFPSLGYLVLLYYLRKHFVNMIEVHNCYSVC